MIKDLKQFISTYRYSLLLLYLPLYLAAFFIIDNIPAEHYIISCPLDEFIPFNQYMIIPYAIWYAWFPGWLLFFLLRSGEEFKRLAVVMFSGMTISLIIYVVWPNGIDLREPITGTDVCSSMLKLLRSVDTPYGVCPSIHISSIMAIALVIQDSKLPVFTDTAKAYCIVIALMIAYATMATKQHSIVDVAAGALLSVVLYYIYPAVYKRWKWLREL
ncbi:MAG TPA: hypothetical protein IAB10_06000 [Candidatus Avilachnospira avistercoris]|nr:hypothetical protein [Candidatus Avilachnospira avistercoris]